MEHQIEELKAEVALLKSFVGLGLGNAVTHARRKLCEWTVEASCRHRHAHHSGPKKPRAAGAGPEAVSLA